MYAAPSNNGFHGSDLVHGGYNNDYGYQMHVQGNGNGAPQLPAFNTLFHQPTAVHDYAMRYNNSDRNNQGSVQQMQPVPSQRDGGAYGDQQSSSNAGTGNPSGYYGGYDYASRSAYPGPQMALLPTVPAASLQVNKASSMVPGESPSTAVVNYGNGSWPHLSPRSQAALEWNNGPPYQNVVIQKDGERRNCVAPPVVENNRISLNGSHVWNGQKNHPDVSHNSVRTNEEKEVAATLAQFCAQKPSKSEMESANADRNATLQRHYQHHVVKPIPVLQGNTPAATAENIYQFAQRQQRQQGVVAQNGSPVMFYGRTVLSHSESIRGPAPIAYEQKHHVVDPTVAAAALATSGRAQDIIKRRIFEKGDDRRMVLERTILPQQQRWVHAQIVQQNGVPVLVRSPQQLPNSHLPSPVGHRNLQHPPAMTAVSSSLSGVANELIRQLDSIHDDASQKLQQQATLLNGNDEQRLQSACQPSTDYSRRVFEPTILQQQQQKRPEFPANGTMPSQHATVQLQQNSVIVQHGRAVFQASQAALHDRQKVVIQEQQRSLSNQPPPHQGHNFATEPIQGRLPTNEGPTQSTDVMQAVIELKVKKEVTATYLNHSEQLNSTIKPVSTIGMSTDVSNGHIPKRSVDAKIHVVDGGKVKKTAAKGLTMQKPKTLKKLKLGKISVDYSEKRTLVTDFQFPNPNGSTPLSLSDLGYLSLLIKNSSNVAGLTKMLRRNNLSAKAESYYSKLPTMFGTAAASLSLSNGATGKFSDFSEATTAASSSEGQARPSGPIFTNGKKHVYAKIPVIKQEMANPLSDRIPLPDGTLESEDSLRNRLENNETQPVHSCNCTLPVDASEGPYYTHLAAAPSVEKMRALLEDRFGEKGPAIRIEKVRHTKIEGKTPDGCPIAKWVIRRSGPHEKILCVVRQRPHHFCSTAIIAVIIVIWDGVVREQADDLYDYLVDVLPKYGVTTNRRCETNDKRLCACQGTDQNTGGASFSFGCSWSMYSNTCKFCKSKGDARKFKLTSDADSHLETLLEDKCHKLADAVAPVFKRMAPACYRNQTYYSEKAQPCRLGHVPLGPFSGITACVDFCAHAHKDIHNMNNGCTVVVTLTKHRGYEKPIDEQLHVLPLCVLEPTDESGSRDNQWRKAQSGALEILGAYPMTLRLRHKPLPACKERTKQQKQRPGRPLKSKQPRLDSRTPEPTTHIQSPVANAASNWVSFGSIANVVGQNTSYGSSGVMDQTQRLPSMDTFSQFCFSRTQSTPGSNGFQYANGLLSHSNGMINSLSSPSHDAYDLAGFAQGFRTPPAASCNVEESGGCMDEGSFYTTFTDNRDAFADPEVGGVAVALTHGSVLLEVAKQELHATTALKTPNRSDPKRISLVFYQHKHLNYSSHGSAVHEKKTAAKKNGLLDVPADWLSRDNNLDDDKEVSKGPADDEKWPVVAPVQSDSEWKIVGAKNPSMSLVRDKVVTAAPSKKVDCRPTQHYTQQILAVLK